MIIDTNKEISKLKLFVTLNCILNCKYCFVKKSFENMNYKTAEGAVNFFLGSPGDSKILMILGGEPLLCFSLLKKIISFSIEKAYDFKKKLVISLATNGILFEKKHIAFLKKHNVKVSISIDGKEYTHNNNRVFKNGKGTFKTISRKLPLVLNNIDSGDICALLGVDTQSAKAMFNNFIYLNKLGFESINIEPIQGVHWVKRDKAIFIINLKKILQYLLRNIKKGNFVFLNSVSRELNNKILSNYSRSTCLFYQDISVYPQGEIAFLPFLFRREYSMGNIRGGLFGRFKTCSYNLRTSVCKNCRRDYYNNCDMDYFDCEPLFLRNKYSIRVAEFIVKMADKYSIFKEYIREAKKRIFE